MKTGFKSDVLLKDYTTLKIGGPAARFYEPASVGEMAQIIKDCQDHDLYILGNGSNVLFEDEGYNGWILHVGENWSGIEPLEDSRVRVKSGTTNGELADYLCKAGLAGYEFASGIPGTVGGAIMMNAGAYDGETKDVLESVRWLDSDGKLHETPVDKLKLSYRHSLFTDMFGLIVDAIYHFEPGEPEEIRKRIDELHEKRYSKQPMDKASCGSTFKRPAGGYASALIAQSGLKGYRVGDAAVSEKHAGFLINDGNATCADFLELVRQVSDKVYEDSGIRLELEVHRAGKGK